MAELKLTGMLSAYEDVMSASHPRQTNPEQILFDLLQAESAERKLRAIRYQLGQARFPLVKDLDSFDLGFGEQWNREVR